MRWHSSPIAFGRNEFARAAVAAVLLFFCLSLLPPASAADDGAERFFEAEIRPILVHHCSECHGAEKQESGLRLDSAAHLLQGGDRGEVIVPGDAAASRLIQAVRYEGDLEMPPAEKLKPRQIEALANWIKRGAVWPAGSKPFPQAAGAQKHWAFQPVARPRLPEVSHAASMRTPIDAFVLARLDEAGLAPSVEADRRTLIRRVSYTLTGLPPTAEEVERFLADREPRPYERLVDRLLASPHYGEHWGRHWLDVARYSDTKGYVYAREERFWVHAWPYRDWVVEALNSDMPYDRFLLLQLAADQVTDRRQEDLAAMGFLTLGRRFLGVKHDIIDDRIDVVTRGMLGLTVSCARCHDHKYDPIPTADYYSLYGVFDSCAEQLVDLGDPRDEAFAAELGKRQEAFRSRMAAEREASAARVRARVGDYLHAQTELEKYPAEGFDQIFSSDDLLPAFVRRWEKHLREARTRPDPVFSPWHDYAQIPADEGYDDDWSAITQWIQDDAAAPDGEINRIVAQAFATPPDSFAEVIQRYAKVFADVETRWQEALAAAAQANEPSPTELADPAAEQIRKLLYGPDAPCTVPDESITHIDAFFPTSVCEALWKLQGEIDRQINASPTPPRFALTLVDRDVPNEPYVFHRGNPLDKRDAVTRHFLSLLSPEGVKPFKHGSGRRELADAIVDPANPLTARVMVNRVWAHHFGRGLVATPSDFGTRAGEPSHAELLDWLAAEFVSGGWSLKRLHRSILLSSTYRQSPHGPSDPQSLALARQIDPGNRLLWRMTPHRLSFEEYRDSLLVAAGELRRRVGGKPAEMLKPPYLQRRTLYGLVDRQFLPTTLRIFDFANPDLHIAKRSQTTVPQQALFTMNHPLVLQHARSLASAAERPTAEATIAAMIRLAYQRPPTAAELAEALEFVEHAGPDLPAERKTAADWQYGFGRYDEENERLEGFTPLPHFTGAAWQGGVSWPDGKLGWVQLTAAGGHPGNDREHACVRRWTAPRDMTIAIDSKLTHDAAPGDGVRAFVVSNRNGQLHAAKAHRQAVDLDTAQIAVEAGDTIDFVVDIGDVLHSDQFSWPVEIRDASSGGNPATWDSQQDFPANQSARLTVWQQLAQILLCSNEFVFID